MTSAPTRPTKLRLLDRIRSGSFAWRLLKLYLEGKIHSGPFAGLKYLTSSHGSSLFPKYLGTYELEIQPWIHEVLQAGCSNVIVIGAAEGYYAVGLASFTNIAQIDAFELEPSARTLLAQLAHKNGVQSKITIHEECTPDKLQTLLSGIAATESAPLLIVDVEGFEEALLDPARIPELMRCDIIVEFHDFLVPAIGGTIQERLASTHTCRATHAVARRIDDGTKALPRWLRVLLGSSMVGPLLAYMDEGRPSPQEFAFFKVR